MSVRVSEEERKELTKYGTLSRGVREGVKMYLKAQKSREIFRKLEELQRKNPVKTTSEQEVELIGEDRGR